MPTLRATSSNASTAGTYTCPIPTGTVQGDLMIALQSCATVTPDGKGISGGAPWATLLSNFSARIFWKFAGAAEVANYTVGNSNGNGFAASTCIVSIADPTLINPSADFTPSAASNAFSDSPGFSPNGIGDIDLRWVTLYNLNTATVTIPAGYTQIAAPTAASGDIRSFLVYKQLTSSAPVGTQRFNYSATVNAPGYRVQVPSSSVFTGWGMPI